MSSMGGESLCYCLHPHPPTRPHHLHHPAQQISLFGARGNNSSLMMCGFEVETLRSSDKIFVIGGKEEKGDSYRREGGGAELGGNGTETEVIFSTQSVNVEVARIQDSVQILLDYKEKGKSFCNQPPPSIYMVPRKLRDQNPDSFTPAAVSIGPLHNKHENVQELEERKATYLHFLLDRSPVPPEQTLESCLLKVTASMDRIKACYAYVGLKSYTDDELAKMMVIDACFILEHMLPSVEHSNSVPKNISLSQSIGVDLVLLENQIPFFVLQDIFDCTLMKIYRIQISLTSIILKYFEFLNPFKLARNDVDGATADHIVGILQRSFHPSYITSPTCSSFPGITQTVMELDKAGVKFKPNEDISWQLAMEFIPSPFAFFCHCWGNPTLKMPTLRIQNNTELVFRNIIAYEQCTPGVYCYFTSYLGAMDMLIDTTDDILKLVESKVIINSMGSHEEATGMINNICNETVSGGFYYGEEWKSLDGYYNGYWPKQIAWLKHTYFNSPWNIIALTAALILFTLTMIQTVFTVNPA